MSDKLSRTQVELVLRRAAELDRLAPSSAGPGGSGADGFLEASELARLAEEAGLRPSSVSSALSELTRGVLTEPMSGGAELGADHAVISRVIPVPARVAGRALERFLRQQMMVVESREGGRTVWRRARGMWRGLAHSVGFVRRHALGVASRVETEVRDERDGTSAVTFRVDLSDLRREELSSTAIRGIMAFACVGLGGTVLIPGFGLADALALAAGSALAGATVTFGRWRYLRLRRHVLMAPERFLRLLADEAPDLE